MNRTLPRLALGVIAAAALFAVACGGGGGGIGGGSANTGGDFNKDPLNLARVYYVSAFGMFTGDTNAEGIMKFYEESCRAKVAPADVNKGIEKARESFPKLKGQKVEDIDFAGKAKVTKTDKGATVAIPSANDSRVKVNGKWQNAYEYFSSVGFIDESEKDDTDDLELVLSNGRYFDSDCETLTNIADSGRRANATPTPARGTPTPVRTTPTATTGNRTPTPSATSRSGASSSLSNSEVDSSVRGFYVMMLGVFSGQSKAADVTNFFTSDCRSKVTSADVTRGLTKLATNYPKMKTDKIEDLDFQGKMKFTVSGDKYTVVLPGSKDMRIKVNGQFINLHTYALNVGIEDSTDSGSETEDGTFVLQGGKLYAADCDILMSFASIR